MKKKKIIDYDLIEKQAYESYLSLKKDNNKDFKLDNYKHVKIILNLATRYIDKNFEKPEYVNILNTLVNLEDSNSIILFLDKINYPIHKLESSITSFIVNYRPDLFITSVNYIYSLEKKIKIYKEYLRKKEIQRKHAEKYKPEEINQAIKLITKYINDDLPTQRFCWEHSVQRNLLEKKANIIKHFNSSLYDAFINKKEELDLYTANNIDNDVKKILELIKNQTNDKPFNHLTYFLTTKFSFREIVNQGDIILNNEDAKILRNQLTLFYNHFTIYNESDIKWFQESYITINVDGEILEFTNREKQMALSYLVTNNIPISYDTLTEVFIKKYKEIKDKETKEKEYKNIFQAQYEIAKQAYQLYENCKGNTVDLSRAAKKMNMKKNVFFSYIRMYLLENSKEHIFDQIYETIIHMENNEQIINYLNSINAPAIALEDNLIFYVCNYRPDILYGKKHNLESLRRKIALYVTYKETLPKSTKEIAYYDKIKDFAQQMINSEYSLKRIACNRQMLSDGIKRCQSTLKITDPTLYNDFITSVEVKSSENKDKLKEDLDKIMIAIKELGNNFTIIDFYLITRFTPLEIVQEAEKTLDVENIKLLKKYIAPYRDIKCINSLNFPSLITDKLVLNIDNNLIEIQPEVKKQIIDFLKNNEIPVSNETLKISCIKYYRNELYKNIDSIIY